MRPAPAVDFESRYRADPDPWDYATSPYERDKYRATLAACGPGRFRSGLEFGASIGVFSALLAPRCRRLTTIDLAPTAVAAARRRVDGHIHVELVLGPIPQAIPAQRYDLVVASEILYYLSDEELAGTLRALERTLVPGGRLVAVHWRPSGLERPRDAADAHGALLAERWLAPVSASPTDDYLLDVLERR